MQLFNITYEKCDEKKFYFLERTFMQLIYFKIKKIIHDVIIAEKGNFLFEKSIILFFITFFTSNIE